MSEKKVTINLSLTAEQINTALAALKGNANDAFNQFKKGADEASEKVNGFGQKAKQAFEGISEVAKGALGVFGGSLLTNGLQGIIHGFEGVIEKGQEAQKELNKLTLAFDGNREKAKEVAEENVKLGKELAVLPERLNEISSNAKITGGATGQLNADVTKLAGGLEKMNVPGLDATAVMRGFLKGAGDPAGAEGLGRLNMAFPQLAARLSGITDPAEKVKTALQFLGPQFKQLAEDAQSPAEASIQMKIAMDEAQKSIGQAFAPIIGGVVLPVLKAFAAGLQAVGDFFNNLSGSLKTGVTVIGVTVGVFAAATIAVNLFNSSIIQSTIANAKAIISFITRNATVIAGTVATVAANIATGAWTAAQWLLNAALNANPIAIVVIAIAALVAGIIYAYNHSEAFRRILNALWDAIKDGIMFFLKWLNPIGLIIQGLKFLYDHVGFVKDGIDALVGAVKSVIDTIKNAGESVLKFLGIMSDETAQEKKTKEAIEQTAAAEELRGKTVGDSVKAYEDLRKAQEDTVKEDESYINSLKTRLRLGGEFQTAANGQKVWVKETEESTAKVKKAIDDWIAKAKEDVRQQKVGTEEDLKTRKQMGLEAESQKQNEIEREKQLFEARKQSLASTLLNIKKIIDSHQGKSNEELKIQSDGSKAIEDLTKRHNENMLSLAGAVSSELQKKMQDSNKAQQEQVLKAAKAFREENFEQTKGMTDEQIIASDGFRTKRLDIEKLYYTERLAFIKEAVKKELEETRKVGLEKLSLHTQQLLLANAIQKQSDDARAFNALRIQHDSDIAKTNIEVTDANARSIKILEIDKKFNDDRYKLQEAFINRQKELRDLGIEADSSKSDGEKKVALLDNQYRAENEKLDEQLRFQQITRQNYDLAKAKASQQYNDAHYAAVKDMLEKESIVYKGAMSVATTLIQSGIARLKGALQGLYDFFFKKQHDEQKKADQADALEKKSAYDKKKKDLQDQLRESKISYEEYIAELAKLDKEKENAKKDSADQEITLAQKTADALSAIAEQALANYLQKQAEAAIVDLLTNQGKAIGKFIVSVADVPFPGNVLLFAAAAGIIGALFAPLISGAKTKKAAKGARVPKRPGGEIYQVGEGDEDEFIAPQETFLEYAHKDLTPKIIDKLGSFDERMRRVAGGISAQAERHYNNMSRGNSFPPIARDLAPRSGNNGVERGLHSTLGRLHKVLSSLERKGIEVIGESRTSGDTIIHTFRNANKKIANRAYPGSRFVAPNSNL